jgi:tyrosyl-tRNA synthetase
LFWENEAETAKKISEFLFNKNIDRLSILKQLDTKELETFFKEIWWTTVSDYSNNILDLLVKTWLAKSKSEGRKLIQQWWIFLNEKKLENPNYITTENDFINWKILLLRKGKKNYKLVLKQ